MENPRESKLVIFRLLECDIFKQKNCDFLYIFCSCQMQPIRPPPKTTSNRHKMTKLSVDTFFFARNIFGQSIYGTQEKRNMWMDKKLQRWIYFVIMWNLNMNLWVKKKCGTNEATRIFWHNSKFRHWDTSIFSHFSLFGFFDSSKLQIFRCFLVETRKT